MAAYEIVPAQEEHLLALAGTMSPDDAAECWALCHWSPEEALRRSVEGSRNPKAGLADGEVIAMFGVAQPTLVNSLGMPWLLGSPAISQHWVRFARESRDFVNHEKAGYQMLLNYVDARHTRAVRWVRWLGFTLSLVERFGPDNLPFWRAELRS